MRRMLGCDRNFKPYNLASLMILGLALVFAWRCSFLPEAKEQSSRPPAEKLIEQVESGSGLQRIRAAAGLGYLGPETLPVIRPKLSTVTARTAPVLLALAARWEDQSAIPFIIPLLDSSEPPVALAAVECLGRLGEVPALGQIVFDDGRPMEMRLAAARALALFPKGDHVKSGKEEPNSELAEDLLIRLLASSRPALVEEAIGSLRYLRSQKALPFLDRLTDSKDPYVATLADNAIRAIIAREKGKTAKEAGIEIKTPPPLPVVSLLPPDPNENPLSHSGAVASPASVWEGDMDFLRRSARLAGLDLTGLHLPARLLDAPDGFRLAWVEDLLRRPLDVVPNLASLVQKLSFQAGQPAAGVLTNPFRAARRILDGSRESSPPDLKSEKANTLSKAIRAEFRRRHMVPDGRCEAKLREIDRALPLDLSPALGNLYTAMANLHQAWENCLAGVRPGDLRFLRNASYSLFDPLSSAQNRRDVTRIGSLVFKLDPASVREAEQRFLKTVDVAIAAIDRYGAVPPLSALPFPWSVNTPIGKVIFYGPGSDTIDETGCLVVDLGGDDRIRCPAGAGGTEGLLVSVYLDVSGNDDYQWDKGPAFGTGFLGTGVLADLRGNDVYRAGHMSLGAGLIGSGVLYDARGDDSYSARSFSQGAAAFGIGILLDGLGTDRYQCGFAAQGFGGSGGVGVLLEEAGDDRYKAGGLARDAGRDASHFLSMSQGFGLGLRYLNGNFNRFSLSGGVGVLADLRGDDRYDVDVFGQGAGYYFGAGLLFDGEGNDRYKGYNYTQGAGVHSAAGALMDGAGNDVYGGTHHSAGNGLDRGVGIVFDLEGDDRYDNNTDCQGAGVKPFGLGILVDHEGDDTYRCRTGRGFARIPQYWASQWPTGLFLDRFGRDKYDGDGLKSNHTLLLRCKRGLGVDGQ